MQPTFGQTAIGDRFYPRDTEINLIYKRLQTGGNLYLNAPRRVGKTSIMLNLKSNPRKGYRFIYHNFEGCLSVENFFKSIVEALMKSEIANPSYAFIAKKTKEWVKTNFPSVKGLELSFLKLDFSEIKSFDWAGRCLDLLGSFTTPDQPVVVLIDEFPQLVENIHRTQSPADAENFLHIHRALRQDNGLNGKVQFILTGSTSLAFTVSKVSDLKVVDDLDYIPVGPLSVLEAEDFIGRLLYGAELHADFSTIKQLVQRIDWLIPFHIQLWFKGISQQTMLKNKQFVNAAIVDEAYELIFDPGNRPYFEHYFSRLPRVYRSDELKFVCKLLTRCADGRIRTQVAKDLADQHNSIARFYDILDSLKIDGYLAETDEEIHFQSMILKEWWHRYESRKHR